MNIASVSSMPNAAMMTKASEAQEAPGRPDHDGDADDKGATVQAAAPVASAKASGVGTAVDMTA